MVIGSKQLFKGEKIKYKEEQDGQGEKTKKKLK